MLPFGENVDFCAHAGSAGRGVDLEQKERRVEILDCHLDLREGLWCGLRVAGLGFTGQGLGSRFWVSDSRFWV